MFSRGYNPIWSEFNAVGELFDDRYYAFFLQNTLPYNFQSVFTDPNGFSAWSNPIQFQPNGELPDNIFFPPGSVYRIEFRQGPDQTYPLIGNPIENYVPNGSASTGGNSITTSGNIVINPQFSDVSFGPSLTSGITPTFTITAAGTYQIAPGWSFVTTGTGTATLSQVAISGNNQLPGNPPYALQIVSAGFTTAQLIQTLPNNGGLFGGGTIGVSLMATVVGASEQLTANYSPSTITGPAPQIFSQLISAGNLTTYYGVAGNTVLIPASTNSNSGSSGFVNFVFNLPVPGNIELTNIMIVGQSTPLTSPITPPGFQEQSYPEIVSQEFYYYRDSILNHPKDTILTGWNFALNPWQFTSPTIVNVAANQYTADQTIVLQQYYIATAGVTGNNIAVGQSAGTYNYGLQVNAVLDNNQFALLQYIDASTIRPYWGQNLSAMVRALLITTQSSAIQFKVRLLCIPGVPNATTDIYPIASWTAGSDPVFSAVSPAVTAIAPLNDPIYTLNSSTPMFFPFNKFTLPASTNVNMTLGILIYTINNMSATGPDGIVFNDISLVQNDFAVLSNPQTFDTVLKQCQYYWEKSYNNEVHATSGTYPATYVGVSSVLLGNTTALMSGMDRTFKTAKRITPNVLWFSPVTGSQGFVYNITGSTDVAVSTNSYTGKTSTGVALLQATISDSSAVAVHWTADARIG